MDLAPTYSQVSGANSTLTTNPTIRRPPPPPPRESKPAWTEDQGPQSDATREYIEIASSTVTTYGAMVESMYGDQEV